MCEFLAVGDARQVADAAITTGQSTVTSATANFTASDVGKAITIQSATSATVAFATSIVSVQNSTTATVLGTAGATVSSKHAMIGTKNNTPFANACAYAGSGAVWVPAGTYLFQGASFFFTVANQAIIGEKGSTLLADGSVVRPFQFRGDGHEFRGLTFDHNWAGHSNPTDPAHTTLLAQGVGTHDYTKIIGCTVKNSPLYGIAAQNQSHLVIKDCYLENIGIEGINVGATSAYTDFLIAHNSIDNTMVDGTLPVPGGGGPNGSGISAGGARNIRIIGNTVLCPPATTPSLSVNSQGIIGAIIDGVISGNTVEGSRIAYSPAGPTSSGIAFTGNTAFAPLDYAFEFPDVANVSIVGNVCDGGGVTGLGVLLDGGGFAKDGAHVTIMGNTIVNMSTSGGTGIGTQNMANHHLTIGYNNIAMSAGEGIYLKSAGAVYSSIVCNVVRNMGTTVSGVKLEDCDYVTVMGNVLVGSFTNPVSLFETVAATTRTRLTVIGNISDKAQTVVVGVNLIIGAGCRIHSNSADAALTAI